MKTYIFCVVLEEDHWPDEPKSAAVWRAYVPSLESLGAATWGETPQEVLEMTIDELIEEGKPIKASHRPRFLAAAKSLCR